MSDQAMMAPTAIFPGDRIAFRYRNWRGEVADREVEVGGIEWGATEWHPEPQWLLRGLDMNKREERLFAMRDMEEVRHAG